MTSSVRVAIDIYSNITFNNSIKVVMATKLVEIKKF